MSRAIHLFCGQHPIEPGPGDATRPGNSDIEPVRYFVANVHLRKPTAVGIATGAVAGLVAITPASGTAGPMGALLIGAASGAICYFAATSMKRFIGYDDSLDVFGVLGVGGMIGATLTGLCAAEFMGGAGIEAGSVGAQVWAQLKSIGVTVLWSGVVSFITLKAIDIAIGIRADEVHEVQGLDISHHEEAGYNF